MVSLIVSYTVLYMIEPDKNEYLLFIWMLQFGAGIGLIVNNQEISRMFPSVKGLVLAILNMACEGSSLWPGIDNQNGLPF